MGYLRVSTDPTPLAQYVKISNHDIFRKAVKNLRVDIPDIGSNHATPFPDFIVIERLEFDYTKKSHEPRYITFKGEDSEWEAICPNCKSKLRTLIEVKPINGRGYTIRKFVLACESDVYAFDVLTDREIRLSDEHFP